MDCSFSSRLGRASVVVVLCFLLPFLAVGQQQSQSDLLSLSIEDLTKVQVYSASRHLEDSRHAPSAVTVITAEEITRYGWRTLGDVLRSVRGFYTSYDRDYTYLGVRGFLRPGDYNSRILLMIDGHRLNDNVYDSAQIGTEFPLDLDLVDHIEIVRGPSSSLFGTNAVFGVINVITRRPGSGNSELQVTGEQSSFLGRAGAITSTFQKGPWSALLSGSMFRSDGESPLYFQNFSAQNGGLANDIDGEHTSHAFADLETGELRFQGLYSTRTKLVPTAPYGTNFDDPAAFSTDTRGYFDVSYHHDLSPTTDLDARAYFDKYDSVGQGAFGGSDPSTRFIGLTEGHANWLGTEATIGHQMGRQRITMGADYEYSPDVDLKNYAVGQPPILNISHSPWMAATYAELELNLVPKLSIHAGGRFDYFSEYSGALSPRVALVYSANPRTTLKYVFGRAFRIPNAYESYYADGMSIEPTTTALKAEHIATHEVIFERSLVSWLGVSADGFYNELTNLIDEQADPATGLNHFVNSGHDRGQGIEFELSAVRSSGLAARASYTFADAKDIVLQSPLANSPSHLAKLNGTLPLAHRAFAGVELLYSSAQSGYARYPIPSSLLTNFTLSTKPLWKSWEFSASCYNLFNQSWFAPAGPELREYDIPQEGRSYRLKLSYRLPLEHLQGKP